jgi:hypothetical protein
MHFGERSFEQLVWSVPTHATADWFEIAALLTPIGLLKVRSTNHETSTVAVCSSWAGSRVLVLGYANRVPVRIGESLVGGRRPSVHRDAHFEGNEGNAALRFISAASRRLEQGETWIEGTSDPCGLASALWRATLLCNGLIRAPGFAFTVRVSGPRRAAALIAAGKALELEPKLERRVDGLRIALDAASGDLLLDQLLDSQRVSVARAIGNH